MMEEDALPHQPRTAFVRSFFSKWDHYKRLLLKFWWIPALTCGISVEVQSLLLKRAPPAFVSEGRMIVNVKVSIPDGNVYSEEVNNFYGTQVALMQSDTVMNRVRSRLQANHLELHPQPVIIDVTVAPKSSIFDLHAVGEDPAYTQAYLQAIMDEYTNLKRDLIANASSATEFSVQEQLKQMEVELQKAKETVFNFQSSNKEVFLQPSGGNSAADYLSSLNRQLAENRSELELLKGLTLDENLERQRGLFARPAEENDAAKSTRLTPPSQPGRLQTNNGAQQDGIPSRLGSFEASYMAAKQELILLEGKKEGYLQINPTVNQSRAQELISVNEQIERQKKMLNILEEESRQQLENQKHVLEAKIKSLENLVSDWEKKALEASKKLAVFESLQENQKRLQTRYDQMQANLQRLEVDKGIGQESVTPLEAASPPVPLPPQKLKHLIMAGLLGLILGIGIPIVIDRLDDRPTSSLELEQLFRMPVLAQFPLVKPERKVGVRPLQLNDERYPMIEAYRGLRSALIFRDSVKNRTKSIMISSARPNDGKSMVSANFAFTLAQAGARVLLIDADLRRGILHKNFSTPASPGLAEVLAGKIPWTTAIVPTSVPNLDLVPCGEATRQRGNLFAEVGKFLLEMPRHYDYYLFDTSPVMVGDDVLSLAPYVDGVIMVVRAGFTSGRLAQAALESLSLRQVNVIGLVFNGVDPNASNFHYYRFKEYYPRAVKQA